MPAAPRIKLVPLLAGHLATSQWLSARWQEQCLCAFWQASPAEDRLMHWNRGFPQQDVHFAFKFSKEASGEAASLRGEFTCDVAHCLLAQCAARPPQLQGVSRQDRGATVPPRHEPGEAAAGKLRGQGLCHASPCGARLPRTLGSSGNRLSVWRPRDPPISSKNKATSKLILIYSPQEKKNCYPADARHQ